MDGKNQNFERPVLILKKFDESNFLGLPISSQKSDSDLFYNLFYKDEETYLSLKQIRYLNIKRLSRLIRRLNEKEFNLIKQKIINFLI